MADFQLQLDVLANTAKLEQGLRQAESKIEQTSNRVDKMAADGGGWGQFTMKAAKAAAAFGAIEIAAGGISTIGQSLKGVMASFAGETEKAERAFAGALEAAKQLPFGIGGTIDKVNQLAMALAGVEDQLAAIAKIEADIASGKARKEQVLAVLRAMQDVRRESELELELLMEQDDVRRSILEVELDMVKQVDALRKSRDEALKAGMAEQIVRENYRKTYEVFQAIRNERIRQIEAEEEMARIADEQAKAAQQQAEAAARQAKFAEQRLRAEQEIANARMEAERQVAGATATFATAGGSFTAGVSAQVNEAKLLTKISQQSRDFLAQIVQNTMGLPGVLSLG